MARKRDRVPQPDPEVERHVRRLIREGVAVRLPELFTARPDAVYRVPERRGVSLTALPTSALRQDQLVGLMRYRLGQYLEVNFVDPVMVHARGWEHEPLSGLSEDDIHIVAGSARTGEVLCYVVVKAPPKTSPGTLMRDRDRPLFPVEKVHGWGIYNRLRILPDLPVARVREMGRFVKNQRFAPHSDQSIRGPVEVCVAAFRLGFGPLAAEVDAYVGDFEESIAKQNIDFFHVPTVVIHGTVPFEGRASYLYPRYQYRTVYPFAILRTDGEAALPRLEAIEHALARPGKLAVLALMRLRGEPAPFGSALEPAGGLPPLDTVAVEQKGVPMETRRELIAAGERLRSVQPFGALSTAEAAVLATFLRRVKTGPGEVIVRQGDVGDALFVVESGQADVLNTDRHGERWRIAARGPGDYFGEIAVLSGGDRTADVVAATPMALLRLSRDDYVRYLSGLTEVGDEIGRTAQERAATLPSKEAG